MAQVETQAPSESELEQFHDRFLQFIDTLEPREKQIVGTIIMSGYSWPVRVHELMGDDMGDAPSDEELEGVVRKLDELHDSLPGRQHEVLDALVGAALGEEMDVQPYGWIWQPTQGNPRRVGQYMAKCFRQQGDIFSWNIVRDRRTGRMAHYFGCYQAD